MVRVDLSDTKVPQVIRGSINAIKSGKIATLGELLPTVAKKSGDMRVEVKETWDGYKSFQLVIDKDKRTITIKLIKLKKGDMKEVPYTTYHFHPHARFGSVYKDPTTLGTVPQDTRIWNRRMVKNTKQALPQSFIDQGVKVV